MEGTEGEGRYAGEEREIRKDEDMQEGGGGVNG